MGRDVPRFAALKKRRGLSRSFSAANLSVRDDVAIFIRVLGTRLHSFGTAGPFFNFFCRVSGPPLSLFKQPEKLRTLAQAQALICFISMGTGSGYGMAA
jgi:hypothetical protein